MLDHPAYRLLSMLIGVVVCLGNVGLAAPPNSETEFFERKIRPVLVQHCYECHGGDADLIQGGLRLDDPSAMIRGGDSGAAVTPGKPDKSLLLAAIRYDKFEMPPDGPLDERVVKDFETWIEMGAVDPREHDADLDTEIAASIDWESAREFWAFQPPRTQEPPSVVATGWPQGRIDRFVLARLEHEGLTPNPTANKRTLIRRLSFDLIGLPPTINQVNAFLADERPSATERLVDSLLSSPQHAERWARLWLDVARYAEDQAHKVGSNDALTYPNAYAYRDWVINALASDIGYDEFVRLQLAADLVDPLDLDSHMALGFLGLGPKYYRRNSPEVMADEWEDRVDTVSRGLLGLTVACARCHDHKFDPIPTSDYYALAGVFAGTEMFNRPINESVEQKGGQAKKPQDAYHLVREGKPRDLNVMIRGDVQNQGPLAKRGFLTVVSQEPVHFESGSGRLELAEAIIDRSNPLTARVIVNRVWHQLMGRPLVGTTSNFGALGEVPSHPNLLDDLSVRFMENGWSLKWLQRQIVLSAVYQQNSQLDASKAELDPTNRLLWRMPRRRLNVEGYRDAVLQVAGQLNPTVGGKSIQPDQPKNQRRTVYSEVSRMDLNPMLARFDFPDPNVHSAARYETTTPLQKLFLLNSPFLVHQADALADRVKSYGGSHRSKIEYAYQLLYARLPSALELELGEAFVEGAEDNDWSEYAQALLISNEMFMVD
ncbi:MAG: PSD1 and planctomycete cytochrome C domain-containing protein [Rubripirellula sp.]